MLPAALRNGHDTLDISLMPYRHAGVPEDGARTNQFGMGRRSCASTFPPLIPEFQIPDYGPAKKTLHDGGIPASLHALIRRREEHPEL
ncbi:hypothetical protein VTO73DRAFT_9286 [Trametes versicolor]